MSKSVLEFEFVLNEPINIHQNGEITPVRNLLIKAPTNAHKFHLIKLQQGYMKAMLGCMSSGLLNISDNIPKAEMEKEVAKEKTDRGDGIISFMMASDIDFNDYLKVFGELLVTNLCVVNNAVALNKLMFDQIDLQDALRLLGRYLEDFLLPTWNKTQKSK